MISSGKRMITGDVTHIRVELEHHKTTTMTKTTIKKWNSEIVG